jgi:DNA-binding XRE family transcriptional regulator
MTSPEPMQVVWARRVLASRDPRQIREDAGLTQEQMSELIGLTASAVSLLEAGRRKPRSETAVRWASALVLLEHGTTGTPAAA